MHAMLTTGCRCRMLIAVVVVGILEAWALVVFVLAAGSWR
jgi:hypothetical protein